MAPPNNKSKASPSSKIVTSTNDDDGSLSPTVVPSSSSNGSKPTPPLDDIDRLNQLVARKVEKEDGVEITALKAVKAGAQVYHRRVKIIVLAFMALSAYLLTQSPSLPFAFGALAVMFFTTDLYSAVLHIVLDEPEFINMPIISTLIGPACLEFQWHHSIPHDIVSKSYLEVCGDLNLVVILHLVWHVFIYQTVDCHTANTVAAAKVIMAYMGQWSHRMAHAVESRRPGWVIVAQKIGLLLPPDFHRVHHTHYDQAFPILNGTTGSLVAFLLKLIPNRRIWLFFFLALSLTDIYLVNYALTYFLGVSMCPTPSTA